MKGELLALVKIIEQRKHILKNPRHPPFLVYTDASSLNYIVRRLLHPLFINLHINLINLQEPSRDIKIK